MISLPEEQEEEEEEGGAWVSERER